MTRTEKLILLPKPQKITAQPGIFTLAGEVHIRCEGDPDKLNPIAKPLQQMIASTARLKPIFQPRSSSLETERHVILKLDPSAETESQGYKLHISPEHITVTASDLPGVFYGVMTLKQILRQSKESLPACEIHDHPDFPSRGVMLDISRDKVPTMDTLFGLVDQLSEWKINHLELYMEHTFAYRNHREVWEHASPMTADEVRRLDAYCQERFVELVPNQNSFGHMPRWLQHPRYRHLAECADDCDKPAGEPLLEALPFSLNPTHPGSIALLEELYAELLPNFSSGKFNVGCDETFDLGLGKSKAACQRKGKGRVYLEFLLKIHELVRRHGRTMHFWGDIILQHPELIPELPRDLVALAWGYESDHPFDEHGEVFARSGIPYYVCPGTSSWQTVAGRTENCISNLHGAALNGVRHKARGYLNTDWGDYGHWQYLPVSYLGFALGADLSWCARSEPDRDGTGAAGLLAALDLHAFHDSAGVMAKLAYDLGNAYLQAGEVMQNKSILFKILHDPVTAGTAERVSQQGFHKTREYIQSVMQPLGRAHMERADADLVQAEFANASRLLLHACDQGLAVHQGRIKSAATCKALADDLQEILNEHRRLWLARNRPGGLQDSVRVLEERLKEYDG